MTGFRYLLFSFGSYSSANMTGSHYTQAYPSDLCVYLQFAAYPIFTASLQRWPASFPRGPLPRPATPPDREISKRIGKKSKGNVARFVIIALRNRGGGGAKTGKERGRPGRTSIVKPRTTPLGPILSRPPQRAYYIPFQVTPPGFG